MRKKHLILFCSLFLCVLGSSAQPTATQEPNLPAGSSTPYHLYADGKTPRLGTITTDNEAAWQELTIGTKKVLEITLPTKTAWNGQVNIPITGAITPALAAQYSKFRFDIWVPAALSGTAASLRFQEGTTTISSANIDLNSSNTSAGAWKTIEINTGSFGGKQVDRLVFLNHLGTNSGNTVLYVDNFLLYSPPADPVPATMLEPGRPAAEIYSVFSDIGNKVGTAAGWYGFNTPLIYTAASGKTAYKVKTDAGYDAYSGGFRFNITETQQLTLTDMLKKYNKIHADVWSSTAVSDNHLRMHLYSAVAKGTQSLAAIAPAKSWKSYDFKLSDFISSGSADKLTGIQFTSGQQTTDNIYYIDNIYLYYEVPACPAPPAKTNQAWLWNGEIGRNGTWTGGGSVKTSDGNKYRELAAAAGTYTFESFDVGTRNMVYMNVFSQNGTGSINVKFNNGTAHTIRITASGWSSVEIPLPKLSSNTLSSFSVNVKDNGGGIYGIDNVMLYYTDNPLPVAQIGTTNYSSIRDAVNAAKTMTGKVEIKVIRSSIESKSIEIPANASWSSLTIYPVSTVADTVKTITHTGTANDNYLSLFQFASGAKNVTINGRMNQTGDSLSLVLQGKYLGNSDDTYNTVCYASSVENISIINCKFKGQSATNRPVFAFVGNGKNITIQNNHFVDCLFLGKAGQDGTKLEILHGSSSVITIDNKGAVNDNVLIIGNNFYETSNINFTHNIVRSFIKAMPHTNGASPIRIVNNRIGGRGYGFENTLYIGHSASSKPGLLWAIYIHGAGVAAGTDTKDKYTVVQGNEIAYINMKNHSTGIWLHEPGKERIELTADLLGGFSGITTLEGLVLVRKNKIHDISVTSVAVAGDPQRYLLTGIQSSLYTGKAQFIIEENEISKLYGSYMADEPGKSCIIMGIIGQMSATGANAVNLAGIIRSNYVITGHKGTYQMFEYSDIGGISARINELKNNNSHAARLDVYNNVSVFNEFKLTSKELINTGPIDLRNQAKSQNGVINCYNNIAYIGGANTAFKDITTPVSGINHATSKGLDGQTNIFHNTVVIKKDAELEKTKVSSAALKYEYWEQNGNGTLKIWNNNLVNLNNNGVAYATNPNNPNKFYSDYNNYYVPAGGSMMQVYNAYSSNTEPSYIKTFDNWKFSNKLSYLNKTTEHDHHSRFLYPCFGGTINPDNLVIPAIDTTNVKTLRNKFTPKIFLGGKKLDYTGLQSVVTKVHPTNYAATVDTTAMDADGNKDIRAAKRREYLPTMGAANTGFTNYWTGSKFVNKTPSTTNTNPWEQDIVFADTANANYTSTTMSVHDIYNDTKHNIVIGNNKELTVTGYIGIERKSDATVNQTNIKASNIGSSILFKGSDGHTLSEGKKSAAAQHIFKNTFTNNYVNNLYLQNNSQYFVLLHGELDNKEPEGTNLYILNDFGVINANNNAVTYPDNSSGRHMGALNCRWYKTTLAFSGGLGTTNVPNLSDVAAWDENNKYKYRPYTGQRIPRHGIYNNEVYNLVVASKKLVTYHDDLYIRRNLNINPTRSFEIAAGKRVRVMGTVNNSGETAGLVIKSRELDAAENALKSHLFSTPRPNATFTYNTAYNNNNIPATVEMYSPAEQAVSEWVSPGGNKYDYRWQYFGTPVSGQAAAASGSTIYEYNPAGDNNLNGGQGGSPYWKLTNGADFKTFGGYCVYHPAKKVYTWKGTLINTNMSKSLPYLKSPITEAQINKTWKDFTRADGKHLLANPYTAAVDIKQITLGSDLEQTIFIYNTGSNAEYNNTTLGSSSAPGTTLAIPLNLAGETANSVKFPRYIPSMQAFTIAHKGERSVDNTISFNYTAGAKNDAVQRAPAYKPDMSSLKIDLRQEGYSSWVLLLTHPDCSKGFDNGWDGRTSPNGAAPLSIFTIEEEEGVEPDKSYYQVSTMDDFNETYLGIMVGNMPPAARSDAGEAGPVKYELVFNNESDTELYLEDLKTNTLTDVSAPGAVYRFIEPVSGEVQKRFRLITKNGSGTTGTDKKPEAASLTAYSQGSDILIDNKGEAGTVSVYDVTGKCIITRSLPADSPLRIQTHVSPGVYLIKAVSGSNSINQSIILN